MDAEEAVKYAFPVAIRVAYPSQEPGKPCQLVVSAIGWH
jgi:hypothetical protein